MAGDGRVPISRRSKRRPNVQRQVFGMEVESLNADIKDEN
jgi:hypothetical protein